MPWVAADDRYEAMPYRRCGRSGLKLPAISLGLWQNFGDDRPLANSRAMLRRAFDLGITRDLGTPLLIHQPSYSMLNRWIEQELLDVLEREGVGAIVFSPLAQGLLTDKYVGGIEDESRVRRGNYFSADLVTEENLARV